MPLDLSPADLCHATLRPKPFTEEGWLFELKHDGFRAFVRRAGSMVELSSRNGRSMAKAFPELVAAIAALPDVVLDAELVVPDSAGRSDFSALQRRSLMRRLPTIEDAAARRPAALIVFDVLLAGGIDMRPLPLSDRKAWLTANVRDSARVKIIEGVETHGEALFAAIVEQGFEGIVGKKVDAPYRAGRQPSWLKIKNAGYFRKDAAGFGR